MRKARQDKGFTLIEMSIVLIVIGFIVGGTLVGRTMVRQSQVNSVMTDVRNYIGASQAFQQKYSALPGDMTTATNYWGIAGGSSGTNYTTDCYTVQGTGTQTCNGDGSGQIADTTFAAGTQSNTYANEMFRAWQHLANAGFISGGFTGVAGTGGVSDAMPGSNIPASRVDTAGYTLAWVGVSSGNTYMWDATYGHVIFFAGRNVSSGAPVNPVLTAAEAAGFDAKFDDGKPGTGTIVTGKPASLPNCETTSVASTAVYNTSSTGNQCFLWFITGF